MGVDVVPPTIILTNPWSHSLVYDSLTISAAAIDNVAMREVVFSIDGSSLVGELLLIDTSPPYGFSVSLEGFERGWHYVSARGYDSGNNVSSTPIVPVKVGFSNDLQDTLVNMNYHSEEITTTWKLPDSLHVTAYWTRFSIARECSLKQVSFVSSGILCDTCKVEVGVWTGSEYPTEADTAFQIESSEFDENLSNHVIDLSPDGIKIEKNFFITISLTSASPGDTLKLASDGGEPFWGRSGCRDEDGWHTIKQLYARQENLFIGCSVYYEDLPDDEQEPE